MPAFLTFWLISSILCIIFEIKNEFRIFKDIADNGYKVDIERLSEVLSNISARRTLLSLFIPGYNLIKVSTNIVNYNNNRDLIISQLDILGVFEKMNKIEEEEYKKNPTALNALITPFKIEDRLENANVLKIETEIDTSEVFFELGKDLNDIKLLKVNGSLENTSEEEIKEKIKESFNDIFDMFLNKNEELIENDEKNNDNISNKEIDFSYVVYENGEQKEFELNDLSIEEQKEILKNLREELLKETKEDEAKLKRKRK